MRPFRRSDRQCSRVSPKPAFAMLKKQSTNDTYMTPQELNAACLTRRQFFGRNALGLGTAALAALLGRELPAADEKKQIGGLPGLPHFTPKAKHVIYLLQNGAPPHVDTFDYKPGMEKFRGQELPESVHKNQRLSTM